MNGTLESATALFNETLAAWSMEIFLLAIVFGLGIWGVNVVCEQVARKGN